MTSQPESLPVMAHKEAKLAWSEILAGCCELESTLSMAALGPHLARFDAPNMLPSAVGCLCMSRLCVPGSAKAPRHNGLSVAASDVVTAGGAAGDRSSSAAVAPAAPVAARAASAGDGGLPAGSAGAKTAAATVVGPGPSWLGGRAAPAATGPAVRADEDFGACLKRLLVFWDPKVRDGMTFGCRLLTRGPPCPAERAASPSVS